MFRYVVNYNTLKRNDSKINDPVDYARDLKL